VYVTFSEKDCLARAETEAAALAQAQQLSLNRFDLPPASGNLLRHHD
jgi:hypothetical protein